MEAHKTCRTTSVVLESSAKFNFSPSGWPAHLSNKNIITCSLASLGWLVVLWVAFLANKSAQSELGEKWQFMGLALGPRGAREMKARVLFDL